MAENLSRGFGIAGFILGLCALFFSIFVWMISPIFAILGLIFSIISMRRNRTGFSIAGLVLSIISIIIFSVFLFLAISYFNGSMQFTDPCRDQPMGRLRDFCYTNQAVVFNDEKFCNKIEASDSKDYCLKGLAEIEGNSKDVCEKISNSSIKAECLSIFEPLS